MLVELDDAQSFSFIVDGKQTKHNFLTALCGVRKSREMLEIINL
jgi:hypothetical protein